MYQHPPVRPSELRPGRGWYAFAVTFMVIMCLLGVGGFVWGIIAAVNTGPLGTPFASQQSMRFPLAPTPERAIYMQVPNRYDTYDTGECRIAGPSGTYPTVTPPAGTFTTTRGGVTWREIYVINVTQADTYTVTCSSTASTQFAIGNHVRAKTVVVGIVGGLAALFVLPGLGILVGVIVIVVVAVKRGNHRRYLIAQRYGPRY